jgi:hypothetical protein
VIVNMHGRTTIKKYIFLHPLHNKEYIEMISPYRAVNTLGCETDQLSLCKEINAFVLRSTQNT